MRTQHLPNYKTALHVDVPCSQASILREISIFTLARFFYVSYCCMLNITELNNHKS
jgi:hypothetical protein